MNNYMVYCLTCLITGKKYVGITKDFHQRWSYHQIADSVIGHALRKYGKQNFRISVLYSRIPKSTAEALEKRLISKMNTIAPNGYNVASGGDGGDTITALTESKKRERANKISKNHARYWKGKTRSDDTKRKISENNARCWKGKSLPDETKKKISESNKGENNGMYGNSHSDETKHRISESMKRFKADLKRRQNKETGQLALFDLP